MKRTRENKAVTEDGSRYNKLQRPDNWPEEPSRRSIPDVDIEPDLDVISADESLSGSELDANVPPSDERRDHIVDGARWKNPRGIPGCLPMDDDDLSGSENGVSFAAMEYLKSVRAEAEDLPVVTATSDARLDEDHDENRGYYEDGAYVVAPELGPLRSDYLWSGDHDVGNGHADSIQTGIEHLRITPCEAYTDLLMNQFHSLRDRIRAQEDVLHAPETDKAFLQQLRSSIPLTEPDKRQMASNFTSNSPRLVEVMSLTTRNRVMIIQIITVWCMLRKQNISKITSLWLLLLLAGIDERTIGSGEISHLRELAKKAIWLRIDFEPRFAEASEAMGLEAGYLKKSEDDSSSDADYGQVAKSQNAANDSGSVTDEPPTESVGEGVGVNTEGQIMDDLIIEESSIDDTTRATLDMIVTIVGEIFGQRDLLESRAVIDWPRPETPLLQEESP